MRLPLASGLLIWSCAGTGMLPAQAPAGWPFAGQNLANTRCAQGENAINTGNAGNLVLKWVFTTKDDVSATPSVDAAANAVYVPDFAGFL